jgi:formylglycine-generating enzyme required for sulfatase activity
MAILPAGSFKMGSSQAELNNNEGPQRTVTFRKPFAVGVYNVTFDQWGYCVADGGCNSYVPADLDWGRGNRPVISVNWDDAQSYVRWLNEKLRSTLQATESTSGPGPYRLLSEAEWEYAARAGTTTAYYWGEGRQKGMANCDGCGSEWDNKQTAPVGSFPPNPFGLYDMAGNVLQWTEDCYHATYDRAPLDGSAWKTGGCDARMMRGGSWFNSTYYIRSSQRFIVSPHIRANNAGFRVAKTLE